MNIFRCYLDLARNMSEKYSFECVKFYTSCFFYVKLQLDILLTLLLYEYFLTCLKKIIFEKTFSFLKIITFDMYTFFVKILYNIAEIKLGIWHADVFSSALRSFLSINLPIFSFKHCFNQKSFMES